MDENVRKTEDPNVYIHYVEVYTVLRSAWNYGLAKSFIKGS